MNQQPTHLDIMQELKQLGSKVSRIEQHLEGGLGADGLSGRMKKVEERQDRQEQRLITWLFGLLATAATTVFNLINRV